MSFFPKPSRSYGTPGVGILGGGALHGMDARSDFSNADTAALAQNLWRDADGSICKRPGFHALKTYGVNGDVLWEESFGGQTYLLYRSGSSYYIRCGTRNRSVGTALPKRQYFKNRLYILCGEEWLILYENGKRYVLRSGGFCEISGETAWNAANTCTWTLTQTLVPIPTVRAGTTPTGKGSLVSPPNRLTPLVRESFTYSASDKSNMRNRFCLAFKPELRGTLPSNENGGTANITEAQKATRRATLTASARLEVRLQSTDDDGNTVYKWSVRNWAYNDNINSDAGAFWIHGIHEADLAMDGGDNIRLTYYRDTVEQKKQANEVLACRVHTLFGVNGYKDRLFVSGQTANTIYYSEMDEPLYFGTLCYLSVGVERDGILLLAGQDTVLTAVSEQGAYLIAGQSAEIYKEGFVLDALFAVSACLPSPAPVGDCESTVAGNELLYLTRNGVCAVAPSGILDERCIQLRSLRLGAEFEQHTSDCTLFCYNDWLLISDVTHETVYLLDLQRKVRSNHAYSSHGYECYIWTGVPARAFFVSDGKLCFYSGNQSYVFKGEQESDFHDEITENGVPEKRPIAALWQTNGLEGKSIGWCSRFFALALRVKGHTGVRLSYKNNRGSWEVFREYDGTFEYPDYRHIYYGQWNYGGYAPRESGMISLPFSHVRRPELRLENDVLNQPFRLAEFIVKYK